MTNKSISQLTAGAAVSSGDLFPDVQSVGVGPVKVTAAQIGDYVLSGSGLTGVLPVSRGGTGLTSLTAGYIPYGNGTGAFSSSSGLQFDGSNLGLGVTPSAWSGGKAVEVGATGSAFWTANAIDNYLLCNAYYNGGFKYGAAAAASAYEQISGAHRWYTAASGTANAAISFTQAMTLDASGRLGINQTTPTNLIHVTAQTNGVGQAQILCEGAPFGYGAGVSFQSRTSVGGTLVEMGRVVADGESSWTTTASTQNSYLRFYTTYSGTSAEKARITSDGNLLVGTTSTSTTSVGWKFLPAVNGSAFVCDTTGDGPTISVTNINATIANGYRWFSFRINSGGTQAGSISYNTGTSQVNYNQTSDRRIKSNITPALPVLEKMKRVEVVSFDMGQGHTDYGVIAQDLHKLFPEAVSVGDDYDEPKTLWGFAGASLVPAMVKAIQELAAKVSALEAKQ